MAAFSKAQLRREIERDRKRAVKARLAELRTLIAQARQLRKEQLLLIRDQCRAERKALSISCANRRAQAQGDARANVEQRRRQIGVVDAEERIYRDVAALDRKGGPTVRKARARARQAESDDEVRANLPPELVPVFDAVRKGIKGTARKSRTEAFLQMAEENPGEVYALQSAQAERDVERLIAEQQRLERLERRRSAVPF